MTVALELDDGIDDVFEHLGSRKGAFLCDVSDEDDRDVGGLGIVKEGGGALAHLDERAGPGVGRVAGKRLYGVDDEQIGLHFAGVAKDAFERRLAQQKAVAAPAAEAVGAQLDLTFALLAADVEHAAARHAEHGLQQEGRLSDARFTAEQDDFARYKSTSEHAVQFGVARVDAHLVVGPH